MNAISVQVTQSDNPTSWSAFSHSLKADRMTERGQAVTIRQDDWHCEESAHPGRTVSPSSPVKKRHTARQAALKTNRSKETTGRSIRARTNLYRIQGFDSLLMEGTDMPDVTIEIDIEECAPFDAEAEALRIPLNFYGADVVALCQFTAVGSWKGSDPFLARESGMVSVSHVKITSARFEGQPLGVDGVAAAQFAVDHRYIDREELSDALSEIIRREVVDVVEWQLQEQWEHLLGIAI